MTVFFSIGVKLDQELLSKLRTTVAGEVITPRDKNYDQARQAWNLTVNQYPALIVIPQNAQDIVEALHFAHQHTLEVAVQATDHGVTRNANNCLLIITAKLNRVQINTST